MAKKKGKKSRRKEHRKSYDAKPTPTHFVRLTRLRVIIDTTRKWFVVRTVSRQERKVEQRLQEIALERSADLIVYRATEAVLKICRGRKVEDRAYPAAGYLFVGIPEDMDRAELWAFSDMEVYAGRDDLFKRIMGPFKPDHLQRFADRIRPPPVLELCHKFEGRLAVFQVQQPPIAEGQRVAVTSVLEPDIAKSEAA